MRITFELQKFEQQSAADRIALGREPSEGPTNRDWAAKGMIVMECLLFPFLLCVSVHHSIRLNKNTDVMQQVADFITAVLYM